MAKIVNKVSASFVVGLKYSCGLKELERMGQVWFFVGIKHQGGEGWFTNFSTFEKEDDELSFKNKIHFTSVLG